MSDMNKPKPKLKHKLINADTEQEVNTGDVVRYGGKPCYVEKFDGVFVWVVTMDERRLSIKLLPRQLGCLVDTTEGVQA